MIHLTRLNNVDLVLNSDLIETMEATPDTVISLTTGKKLMVKEGVSEVVARVIAYRATVLSALSAATGEAVPVQGVFTPAPLPTDPTTE